MDIKVQQLKDEITLAQSRISILMISTLAQMEADTKTREAMYTETLEDSRATITELHSQFSAVKEELDEQRRENKELKEKEQNLVTELTANQKQITDMVPAIQLLDKMQSRAATVFSYVETINGEQVKVENVYLYEHLQRVLIPRFVNEAPSLYGVLHAWSCANAFEFLSIGADVVRTILVHTSGSSIDLYGALTKVFYGEYPEMVDEICDEYGVLVYEVEPELEGLTKVAENVPSTLDVEELVETVETVAKTPASKRPRAKKQPNNSSKS